MRITSGLIGRKRSASRAWAQSAASSPASAAATAPASASGFLNSTASAWTQACEVVSTMPVTSPFRVRTIPASSEAEALARRLLGEQAAEDVVGAVAGAAAARRDQRLGARIHLGTGGDRGGAHRRDIVDVEEEFHEAGACPAHHLGSVGRVEAENSAASWTGVCG